MGWSLLTAGGLIVVINYIDYLDLALLPGGHSEGYLVLGVVFMGLGLWPIGLFDRRA